MSLLLQVWDLKTGQLLRTQTVHRGMVTCLAYATSAKLLFSGSIDGSIGVWTDKGNLLQVWCLRLAAPVADEAPLQAAGHDNLSNILGLSACIRADQLLQPAEQEELARSQQHGRTSRCCVCADHRWCPLAGQYSAWPGATSSVCW
jgi:WD40 repeat protein